MKNVFIMLLTGIIFLSFVTVFCPFETCDAAGNTLYVNDDGGADYTSIQDAVNAASSGDIIHVYSGNYNENVEINKILTITGENKANTIISGATDGDVVTINNANYVNISGFTIQNAVGTGYACIFTNEVQNCKITDNIIKNSHDGIYLLGSNENIISGNTIGDNIGNGISLIASVDNEIKSNIIQNNDVDGIYFYQGSSSNKIYQNTITGNLYYGIILISSYSNTIYLNDFSDNGMGNAKDQASNSWSYNSQGNYWDDYTGKDQYHGPNQDIPGSDGIGDTPYNITGGNNQDTYPLVNQPPVAIIDSISPNPATEGQAVSFHGSGVDNDGYIAGYSWREGTTILSTLQSFSKSDFSVGTHTIYFKVKDDDGAWSNEVSATLIVNSQSGQTNQPPTAVIDSIGPNPATEGQIVYFSGRGIDTDTGDYITGYLWTENGIAFSNSSSFSKSDFSVGTHIIYFKVRDNSDMWSDNVPTTLVVNQGSSPSDGSPTADAGGPYFGYTNATILFNGSGSTDDGTIVYYKWDFGDGTTIIEKSPTHIYTEAKNYTVTLTVTDDGGKTDTDTTYANVSAQATDNGEKNKTPGFEIIFVIISVALIVLWRKHKL